MVDSNPYRPIRAEVLDVVTETPTIKTIRFKPDEAIGFRTGQFVEVTIPGVGEAPFGITSIPSRGDVLEFGVHKLGGVTAALHEMELGDVVGVRGPLGNWFPMSEPTEDTDDVIEGKNVVVLGGGIVK